MTRNQNKNGREGNRTPVQCDSNKSFYLLSLFFLPFAKIAQINKPILAATIISRSYSSYFLSQPEFLWIFERL